MRKRLSLGHLSFRGFILKEWTRSKWLKGQLWCGEWRELLVDRPLGIKSSMTLVPLTCGRNLLRCDSVFIFMLLFGSVSEMSPQFVL
jgi:hypothetical protein